MVLTLAACKGGSQTPRDAVEHPGQALFNGHTKPDVTCFKCHGGDATGKGPGPNLAEHVSHHSDEDLARVIYEGPGIMPSYQGKLSDEEVRQIIAWLRLRFPSGEQGHGRDHAH